MKIVDKRKNRLSSRRLESGDIVDMVVDSGSDSFFGIYVRGIGIIDLEHGSDAYCCDSSTKDDLYVGDRISYWTIGKVCNAILIVN